MTDTTAGKPSTLPPVSDLAQQVRDGANIDDLANAHHITPLRLIKRFNEAGYSARTGLTMGPNSTKRTILQSVTQGAGGNHVGGGDWDRGLPIDTPVPHQRRRPRPTGLDWNTITPPATVDPIEIPAGLDTLDPYAALAGERYDVPAPLEEPVVDAAPEPDALASATTPTPPQYGWDIWTKPETDTQAEGPAAAPLPGPASRKSPRRFTDDECAEIARRYTAGESTTAIGNTYQTSAPTIGRILERKGIPRRPPGRHAKPKPATPEMDGLKLRDGDQPLPVINNQPDIQSQVIADIQARRRVGIQRYGTALQPHNGRDMLLDAYEEAMDLTIYLKGCLVERNSEATR